MDAPDAILARAIQRHGGEAGKACLAAVRLRVAHLGGAIPTMKGLGRTHPAPGEITVEPFERRLTFHDYPAPGSTIVYDAGLLALHPGEGGGGKQLHMSYRETFRGLRKLRRWAPLDAAYFFGYAVSDYLALPWSLQALEITGSGVTRQGDMLFDRLDVLHPEDRDTHSRKQSYYFAPDGLLVRHDYRADVLGRMFTGAHMSSDYDESLGAPIATQRVVRARLGRRVLSTIVLEARFEVLGGA